MEGVQVRHHASDFKYHDWEGRVTLTDQEYRPTTAQELVLDQDLQNRVVTGELELVGIQPTPLPEVRIGGRTGKWVKDPTTKHMAGITTTPILEFELKDILEGRTHPDVALATRMPEKNRNSQELYNWFAGSSYQCMVVVFMLGMTMFVFGLVSGAFGG